MPTRKRKNNASRRRKIKHKSVRRKIRGGSLYNSNVANVNMSTYGNANVNVNEHIYNRNFFEQDPSRPDIGSVSARNWNLFTGGKKRKTKKRGGSSYNAMYLGISPPAWQTLSVWNPYNSASLVQGNGIAQSSYIPDNSNYVPAMV